MQRRQLLKAVAGAGLGAVCAPMINLGRYRVFAGSKEEYSARAVELVGRSVVIDMLSPFKLGSTTWFTNPESFKQGDFQRFKDSGINAFHIAVGTGGVEAYLNTLRFIASWDGFLANHFDLTEGLIRRKYTDHEIELVLGGNFKRVLAQIWSV